MANRYWVGATASWNTAGNWSASSGGGGGAGVPTSGDAVIFDDQDATNCTLDVNANCASLTNTNYVGTLDGATFDLTCVGDFQFDSGALDLGTGTWTAGGNWDTSGCSSFTRGTSRLVLTGASKTLAQKHGSALHNLTVSGSYTATAGTNEVRNDLTVSGTLTYNGGNLVLRTGASSDFTGGTIAGTRDFVVQDSGTTMSAAGTVSCPVRYDSNTTIQARIYGSNVTLFGTASTNVVLGGTVAINGNLSINAFSSGDCTLDAATNDPAFDIGGILDFIGAGAGTEIILAGDGDWNCAGDVDFTGGTFTPALSEVILDGSSAQTVTVDTEPCYDLTSANTAASPGVSFVDALNVTNIFKNITASSVMTFTDSVAYVLNTIDLDGQAVGTRVVLRPSTGAAAYTWNVTTNTQADYVDVSWSDATPGIDITATNSNDGGNNTAWIFGAAPSFQPYQMGRMTPGAHLQRGLVT
jgi:hypothetical protein